MVNDFMQLRIDALNKARNVFKTQGVFRAYNRNKKKSLDVVGVLADSFGIKLKTMEKDCPWFNELCEAYRIHPVCLADAMHKNDTTSIGLVQLLIKLFDTSVFIITPEMFKDACKAQRTVLLEAFPNGIPVTMKSANIISRLNVRGCPVDLGHYPSVLERTEEMKKFDDRYFDVEGARVPVMLCYKLLMKNYEALICTA